MLQRRLHLVNPPLPPIPHQRPTHTHTHTNTPTHKTHNSQRAVFEKTAQYSARNGTFTEISTWFWSLI